MLKVDFYCSVITHYIKMLSIFVHYKSHIFANCLLFSSSLLCSVHFSGYVGVPRASGNTDYAVYSYSINLSVLIFKPILISLVL
jgi:hypothetical protein